MTDTDTTTALDLPRDAMTLVTLEESYVRGEGSSGMRERPDERTFFATPYRNTWGEVNNGFVALLLPVTDSRSGGMHGLDDGRYDDLIGGDGGLTRSDYRTWAVPVRSVTRADVVALEREHRERQAAGDDRPLAVGDRVRVDSPHAPLWNGEGTVRSAYDDGSAIVHMETGEHTGDDGAFSGQYLTRVAPVGPVEAPQTDVRTFTAAEVDRLVDEAVAVTKQEAAEALKEFKTEANRIAVEYAESNELCGNFERCMEDIGLLGREEWHEQHDPEWTVTLTVTVRADDDDTARWRAADRAYNMSATDLYYASTAEVD